MGKGKSKKQCVLAIIDNCVLVALIWMEVASLEKMSRKVWQFGFLLVTLHLRK